jgi:hypothetical protein
MSNQLRSIKYALGICLSLAFVLSPLSPFARGDGGKGSPKVKVLVKGAPIHGANGIYFDAANRLCVGSVASRGFYVLDADSGRILDFFGPAQGVEGADDLIIGPDGAVY